MDNFPLPPTNQNESSRNKPSSTQPEGLETKDKLLLEQESLLELSSLLDKLIPPNHEPSSPEPEDFLYNDLLSDNTFTLSEKELENCDSEFSPSPVSSIAPTTNMPIAATQPEDFPCDDLLSDNTFALSEEELKNFDSELWQTTDIQADINELANSIAPNTPNPDSCTSPKTNMPVAATQPSDNQFPVNRENTMRAPITYEADPKDYIRTCLYALCEPLFMYWKYPISDTGISINKIPAYKQFKDNVDEYLQALCRPPSSDGQHELQSTGYKEKWEEFYNEARIAINELLKTNHTTVEKLQRQNIKTEIALSHNKANTIYPIYSKIYKLCELPLYHTQQEALTSLFEAVDKYYTSIGHDSIRAIGNAYNKDHPVNNRPVNNFKVCTVIPELEDLFSLKQQYINELENKIKELITYIDHNTHPDNLIVIGDDSMINPKYVNMIKDIIIEKIKQDPDYACYIPLIKLGAKPHKKSTLTPGSSLRHTHAYPLVITCQLDESNTLKPDQRDKANTRLNKACKKINEQFKVALNRIFDSTSQGRSSKKSKNKKKLKQLESQATMAQTPVEPMFMPQMTVLPMTPPNIKRQHTSPGLNPETSPKKRKHSNTPPSTPPK